jgi:transposase
MIVKKHPYNPPTQYLFLDQKRKMGLIKKMKKQINKFEITGDDLGLINSLT